MTPNDKILEAIRASGGPAFPTDIALPSGGNYHTGGMTLRDWFAGQAMAAIIAKLPLFGFQSEAGDISISVDSRGSGAVKVEVASGAYAYADAMIADRSK